MPKTFCISMLVFLSLKVVYAKNLIEDIPIDPMLEKQFEWEQTTANQIIDRLQAMMIKEYANPSTHLKSQTGHTNQMLRDAHPKAIGCVTATFKTLNTSLISYPKLPKFPGGGFPREIFESGVFLGGGEKEYKAVVRLSSSAATIKPDFEPDARGMAVKIFGNFGQKWPLTKETSSGMSGKNQFAIDSFDQTQDFILVDHPTLPVEDTRGFNDLVAIPLGLPRAIMSFLIPSLNPFEWRFGQLLALQRFNGKEPANLLTKEFHSVTPFSFSGYPAKFAFTPRGSEEKVPSESKDENILRRMADATLARGEVVYDFRIQLRPRQEEGVDIQSIIEDASYDWTSEEKDYPFIKVATLTIHKQVINDERKLQDCDNLSFNIWNSSKDYRPLGNINRARRLIYEQQALFRKKFNKISI